MLERTRSRQLQAFVLSAALWAPAPFLVDAAWLKANRDDVVLVDLQKKREDYEQAIREFQQRDRRYGSAAGSG